MNPTLRLPKRCASRSGASTWAEDVGAFDCSRLKVYSWAFLNSLISRTDFSWSWRPFITSYNEKISLNTQYLIIARASLELINDAPWSVLFRCFDCLYARTFEFSSERNPFILYYSFVRASSITLDKLFLHPHRENVQNPPITAFGKLILSYAFSSQELK